MRSVLIGRTYIGVNMKSIPLICAALLLAALSAGASAAGIADHHKSHGLDCAVCHGPDKANLKEPATADCTGCHAVDALVAKTKDVKPTNPHMSPHYRSELDCTNCHMGHMESENFCNQCHQFNFKLP